MNTQTFLLSSILFSFFTLNDSLAMTELSTSDFTHYFEDQLSHYGRTFNEALVSDESEFLNLESLGLTIHASVSVQIPWVAKLDLKPELDLEWEREDEDTDPSH